MKKERISLNLTQRERDFLDEYGNMSKRISICAMNFTPPEKDFEERIKGVYSIESSVYSVIKAKSAKAGMTVTRYIRSAIKHHMENKANEL